MKRISISPIIVLFTFIFLLLTACQEQADTINPEPNIDQDALIESVAATVIAQTAQQIETLATPQPQPTAIKVQEQTENTMLDVPLGLDLEEKLIDIYQHINPSVVHIFVFDEIEGTSLPLGTGSGFVFDQGGNIVTNNHVVAEGDAFEIVFADGSRRNAELVGSDVDSDLGVLKVDGLPEGIEPISLGDSNNLRVGQFVIAIGNPFGEAGSMSVGIISGLGRTLESQRIAEGGGRYSLPEVIQTDAAINPGNSGGPLLNLDGEVVGVNSAISTRTGTNSGVGFSIPVNAVKQIVPRLVTDGSYIYPFMGIRMLTLNLDLQEQLDLKQPTGAYITETTENSPASDSGLIGANGPGGDLIIAVDGNEVVSSDDLIAYLVFHTEVGQTIDLTIIRDGEELVVPLTLGERP
jgi:S1-C subfamily serine protease